MTTATIDQAYTTIPAEAFDMPCADGWRAILVGLKTSDNAGNEKRSHGALFTLMSQTGKHYTYGIAPRQYRDGSWHNVVKYNGGEGMEYLGELIIAANGQASVKTTRASAHLSNAPVFRSVDWFARCVTGRDAARIDSVVTFYLSPKCVRCHRDLTNPESIEAAKLDGLGPECRKNYGW